MESKNIEQHALLRTYIAGKLEALQKSTEASKYWTAIVEDVNALTEVDPEEAFKFAVKTLEPNIKDANSSVRFREWWQGTTLIILINQQVRPYLIEELAEENSNLVKPLESFLNHKPQESIKVTADLSPEDFNLVMAMILVNDLQNRNFKSISELEEKTQNLLKDEHIGHVIDLFHSISEDKVLVEPVYQIIHTAPNPPFIPNSDDID